MTHSQILPGLTSPEVIETREVFPLWRWKPSLQPGDAVKNPILNYPIN